MSDSSIFDPEIFSQLLYQKLRAISPGVEDLELDEFRYALDNLYPQKGGWAGVELASEQEIEEQIRDREFYMGVELKPCKGDRVGLDEGIIRLTNMLLVGLVAGRYSEEWINTHFYFDLRGFFFLARTVYFTGAVVAHLGGRPLKCFEPRQRQLERFQGIGYKDFRVANAELDEFFIASVKKLIEVRGTPILTSIAGPTASGKTEIVDRLRSAFQQKGQRVTSIEMDNFLLDIDYRDDHGIASLGKEAYHFELFRKSLRSILNGQRITIPRIMLGVSSHDANGNLKPGCVPLEIEPADVIFLEGNFPFHITEVWDLMGLRIVYLTDDPVRLKRKWKRDIDYRKRYDPFYFCNRFFRTQFLRAHDCYRAQMQMCDLVVDTTGAAIWATPEMSKILSPC